MPLIQRNLFPARKSSNKASGPFAVHATETNEKSRKISTGSKKKLSKSEMTKSASLTSLVAIGKALNKVHHHSGDSGHDSNDGNSSDPSLSSSCGSVDKVTSAPVAPTGTGNGKSGISRKMILSRSRDAINHSPPPGTSSDDYQSSSSTGSATMNKAPDEDVWFNVSTLIEDHIDEIVSKWDQIDDEIWAKVICMERNRRVAKAYARSPILSITGCDNGFDGHRIGLAGFTNPWRDKRVVELKKEIDQGVKLRMDGEGNLLIKKSTKSDVYLVSDSSLTSGSSSLTARSGEESPYDLSLSTSGSGSQNQSSLGSVPDKQFCKLDARKLATLFDMRAFQAELAREMRSMTPNTRALEQQCFKFISFGKLSDELLNTPVWVIVINLVALEMIVKVLPSKLFDDNFYSVPTNNLHRAHYEGISGVPPALPPRDLHNKKPPLTLPEPDYDEEHDGPNAHGVYKVPPAMLPPHRSMTMDDMHLDAMRNRQFGIDDDPYYCGMQAHVPRYQRQESKDDPKTATSGPAVSAAAAQSSMRSNPPIVRRKFWSQTASVGLKLFNRKKKTSLPETSAPAQWYGTSGYGSTGSGYYSGYSGTGNSLYSQPRASTLDYRSGGNSSGYYSNFSLLQSQYCIPVRDSDHLMSMMSQQYPIYQYPTSQLINDNNEIYGVNTSLLRKSAFNRSISSPSLKNMFFSGGKNKDINNNHLRQ